MAKEAGQLDKMVGQPNKVNPNQIRDQMAMATLYCYEPITIIITENATTHGAPI